MLQNIHVLPGPAVDVAVHHDLFLTVTGYPLHPGFEHAEKHPELPSVPLVGDYVKTDEARRLIKYGIQDPMS